MLINVFGLWLMGQNVSYLEPDGDKCKIYFIATDISSYKERYRELSKSCDEVAAEINKQIKEAGK